MMEKNKMLRFDGSIWCNLDIALRNMDQVFRQAVRPLGLTVIEWYVMRALMEQDGQHASELARAVGRAATSFTPNLDKLQEKGMIERRPDPGDRRAVRIYLTDEGEAYRDQITRAAEKIDARIASHFSPEEFDIFQEVLDVMQTMELD
jgi:DNA-binding MarR family transcriptional regulator